MTSINWGDKKGGRVKAGVLLSVNHQTTLSKTSLTQASRLFFSLFEKRLHEAGILRSRDTGLKRNEKRFGLICDRVSLCCAPAAGFRIRYS